MFVLDISTSSPCPSAPYHSLVIRKPYILGRSDAADIKLPYEGIAPEHVSMTVMRKEEAILEVAAATATRAEAIGTEHDGDEPAHHRLGEHDGDTDAKLDAADVAKDMLVVRVSVLCRNADAEIRLGDTVLNLGDSAIVRDGDVLYLGEGIHGRFHYRPLMVGIEADAYPQTYVNDLHRIFEQLGATVVGGPVPPHEIPFTPIGQLYCVAELNDSINCLAALSYGYSIVQPTYVFEWFAAVAKNAATPLSALPAPSRFGVPVRCTTRSATTTYLRPESDTCPFSLFPIPFTAVTNRSRAALFADCVFFFFTDAAATHYWRAVEDCGGAVYGPGDVEAAKEAIHVLVEAQRKAGVSADRLPNNFYIIIDNESEAVLLSSGLESASPELLAFMEEARASSGATHLPVMSDHSLFAALLRNRFYEEPVSLVVTPAPVAGSEYSAAFHDTSDGFKLSSHNLQADGGEGNTEASKARKLRPEKAINGSLPVTARSASRASERHASLLPRSRTRTPSRSQMRSLSRQSARSLSAQAPEQHSEGQPFHVGSGHNSARGASSRRCGGRRRMPSVAVGGVRRFCADFDSLRVRIYIFLVRDEPKLDTAITVYHKNYFVDSDTIEFALEVKAEAAEFMERISDLLADAHCQGAYTEALRRFWRDCRDMDIKAQHLLHCWDRSMPAAALPRRFRSSRGTSVSRHRTGSLRSMTPRGVARVSKSSAPPVPRSASSATSIVNGGVDDVQDAAARMTAWEPHEGKENGEHPALDRNSEGIHSSEALSQAQDNMTEQDVVVGMGCSGTVVSPAASTPRVSPTSPGSSRRRLSTLSPTKFRNRAAPQSFSTKSRPPWVNDFTDNNQSESQPNKPHEQQEQHQEEEQQQQPGESLKSASETPASTPTAYSTLRTRPVAPPLEFATDSPRVVRARSAGRSSNTPARRPSLPGAEVENHKKRLAEGLINLEKRHKEGQNSLTTSHTSVSAEASRTGRTRGANDKKSRTAGASIPEPSPQKKLLLSTSQRAPASARTTQSASASRRHRPSSKGPASAGASNGNNYNQRPLSAVVAVGGSG